MTYTPEQRRADKIANAHAWLNGVIAGAIERNDRCLRMCADSVQQLLLDLQVDVENARSVGGAE